MEEPLLVTISNDGLSLKIHDWQELINWLSQEKAKWNWLINLPNAPNNVSRSFEDMWNDMINSCASERGRGVDIRHAQNHLNPLTGGHVLYSASKDGELVRDILESAGDLEAAAAAAFLTGQANLSHAHDRRSLRGMLLVALPMMQPVASLEARLRQERSNYRESLRRSIDEAQKAGEERLAQFAYQIRRARRIARALWRKQRDDVAERIRYVNVKFTESQSSIQEVENTYKEYMKLKAPVDYWESKAKEHKIARNKAFLNLKYFFILMLIGLFALFVGAGFVVFQIGRGNSSNSLPLYLIISGGLAVISTIGFWFGRLLTRLYLSEHHLQTDAEERAVMARTFLALFNEGVASEADKEIILGALFRATQDGIVNDDGPPDMAMQALAARVLNAK